MLKEIYFPTQNYNRSKNDIFTNLVKVFGGGSRFLFRNSDPEGSRKYLAKIFAWYCALANRLNIDLEDVIWRKFPGVCPRCLKGVCACGSSTADIDQEKVALLAASHMGEKPVSLRHWQMMFANIYRGPAGSQTISSNRERLAIVFSRMAEELGEVAEALLLDDVIDHDVNNIICNEMADLGAWIFSLANNLQYVDKGASGVTLADVAWESYGGKCHRCEKLPCVCVRGSFALELAQKGAMGPSHWDDMTGMANSSGLRVNMKIADSEFRKSHGSWAVVMIDLDDFGQVNKKNGAVVGDFVLKAAAARIKDVVKDNGIAFRRGGEEFVVMLEMVERDALIVAEKIRRAINERPVVFEADEGLIRIDVSASLGVASTSTEGVVPSKLEDISDERMREAKRSGKNQVKPSLSPELISWLKTRELDLVG